jgi:hypothetical protein
MPRRGGLRISERGNAGVDAGAGQGVDAVIEWVAECAARLASRDGRDVAAREGASEPWCELKME